MLCADSAFEDESIHAQTTCSNFRRSHSQVSGPLVFGGLPKDTPLFGASQGSFRTRWNRLFSELGVPTSEKHRGVTPKSLRGSGASWLVPTTAEDVSKLLWRGRWQSRRTLEHYLQDVMGQVLLTDLSQDRRDLVLLLSRSIFFLACFGFRLTYGHPR